MTMRQILGPTSEPLTLEEAKASVRKETVEEDGLIASWIIAARMMAEAELNRPLMRQTWEQVLDDFPTDIELFQLPVQAIETITYVDIHGADQAVPSTDFAPDDLNDLTRSRFWIKRAVGLDWPLVLVDSVDSVRIRYRAGFSDSSDETEQRAAVPDAIKQWMRMQVGLFDACRSPILTGISDSELPRGMFGALLDPYRIMRLA